MEDSNGIRGTSQQTPNEGDARYGIAGVTHSDIYETRHLSPKLISKAKNGTSNGVPTIRGTYLVAIVEEPAPSAENVSTNSATPMV